MIMAELDRRGKGYHDEHISLKSLFFADDALIYLIHEKMQKTIYLYRWCPTMTGGCPTLQGMIC